MMLGLLLTAQVLRCPSSILIDCHSLIGLIAYRLSLIAYPSRVITAPNIQVLGRVLHTYTSQVIFDLWLKRFHHYGWSV
jgi:hypothetical protein